MVANTSRNGPPRKPRGGNGHSTTTTPTPPTTPTPLHELLPPQQDQRGSAMGITITTEPVLSPKGADNAQQPITILLVDDDADCRMLIRDAIAECKVSNSVFEVANGTEALDFLHRRGAFADAPRPGLIYLDIEMPGMDGQETLRAIKSSRHLRDIPVVMMTGVCDEAQMKLAAENGANSYTLKPASAEQFLRTVLASTSYWLTIHQYPDHHVPPDVCRR